LSDGDWFGEVRRRRRRRMEEINVSLQMSFIEDEAVATAGIRACG